MAITLTEKAANHVQKFLVRRGKGVGLRLGVRTTGCSGLAYKLEYVDELAPEDQVFDCNGVKIIVDPKSLAYIDGTELDFAREGLNEGFKFNNPNVKDECVTASTEMLAAKRHAGVHTPVIACKMIIANQQMAYAA